MSLPPFTKKITALLLAAAVCLGAQNRAGAEPETSDTNTPHYDKSKQITSAMSAVQRSVDPSVVASRKSADSRIITFSKDKGWQVAKEGSHGYYRPQATTIKRSTNGVLDVEKGTGIKDRTAERYAGDMEYVKKYLAQAQSFTYKITDSWGTPEDLEKYGIGDCADKSFWLASKLTEAGFDTVKVVFGRQPTEKVGHAWVEVSANGEPYLLETTNTDPPYPREEAIPRYYSKFPPVCYFDHEGVHEYGQPVFQGR